MTKKSDGAAIFGAIAALENEATDLEHRAVAARELIRQLRDHAGAAVAVNIPPAGNIPRQNSKKPDPPKAAPGRQRAVKTRATNGAEAAIAELKKLTAEVAKLDGLIKAEKNAAMLKAHVAALLRVERRGGEVLAGLAGKVKDLPLSDLQRRRWRRLAVLAPKQFEAKVARTAKAAVDGLGPPKRPSIEPAPPKPPSVEPAPSKRPDIGLPVKKLTGWHEDENGALSRELQSS